jgi:hypothetical protein
MSYYNTLPKAAALRLIEEDSAVLKAFLGVPHYAQLVGEQKKR